MTKSAYQYPPDEFDVAVPGGAPVGVHRAPRSGWSSVWPFLLVAVICAGVAWGGITLLNGDSGAAEADTPTTTSASPDPSASASAPVTDPAASASASAPPATPVVDVAALIADADTSASVSVYNVGEIQGLAAATAETLVGKGFANSGAETGFTLSADDYQSNTVLYGADRAQTAKAIAAILGIPETQMVESAEVTASPQAVWVVMRTEATPAG